MDVTTKIKELRESLGWSKNKLAAEAGISQAYVSQLEDGLKKPGIDVLEKICHALGITLTEFFSNKISEKNIPPDITEFSIDKSNHSLIRLIQDLKAFGYSNEVIGEWIEAMHHSLIELGKKYGAAPGKVVYAFNNVSPEDLRKARKFEEILNEPSLNIYEAIGALDKKKPEGEE